MKPGRRLKPLLIQRSKTQVLGIGPMGEVAMSGPSGAPSDIMLRSGARPRGSAG